MLNELMEEVKSLHNKLIEIESRLDINENRRVNDMNRDNAAYLIHMINNDEARGSNYRKIMYINLMRRFPEELKMYILVNIADSSFVSNVYEAVFNDK